VVSPAVTDATEVSHQVLGVSSRILVSLLVDYTEIQNGANPISLPLVTITQLANTDHVEAVNPLPNAKSPASVDQEKTTLLIKSKLLQFTLFQAKTK